MQADAVLRDPLDRAVERIQPPLDVLAVGGQVGPAVPRPGVDDVRGVDLQDEAGVDDRPVERLGRFCQRVDEPLLVAVVLVEDERLIQPGPRKVRNSSSMSWPRAASFSVSASYADRLGGRNSAPVWDVRMRRSLLCMAAVSRPAAHRSPSCVRFRE
jgi:hypothetical protein